MQLIAAVTAAKRYPSDMFKHYCPAKSRTESIGWGQLVAYLCSPYAEVPAKWAFSRTK